MRATCGQLSQHAGRSALAFCAIRARGQDVAIDRPTVPRSAFAFPAMRGREQDAANEPCARVTSGVPSGRPMRATRVGTAQALQGGTHAFRERRVDQVRA
jgi:hypothetical protein